MLHPVHQPFVANWLVPGGLKARVRGSLSCGVPGAPEEATLVRSAWLSGDLEAWALASIERTAYPRFRRVVTARELAGLSPTGEEAAWARERTRSGGHLLALVLALKCFQRLGYFPRADDVPSAVVDHVRRRLELADGTGWSCAPRTAGQRHMVRERLGVVHDPERARAVAAEAIRSAADVKNHPPDLIYVALEMLVKASLELPPGQASFMNIFWTSSMS